MPPALYYFTGNSHWIARQIAERLGGSAISIPDVTDQPSVRADADTVDIVFASYLTGLHGVPLIVERFLGKLEGAQQRGSGRDRLRVRKSRGNVAVRGAGLLRGTVAERCELQ